jgi:hypothetical protein
MAVTGLSIRQMKSSRWLFILLLLPALTGTSQEITVHNTFGGMRFELDTLTITHRQVSELLYVNPVASEEFKVARRMNTASAALGFGGAILVAIPVFTAILGGDPEWLMAAAGGLMIGGSIPLSMSYERKAESAINVYNSGLKVRGRIYVKGAAVGIKL